MRFTTLLVLLFVAMFTLNSMVIACGDCTPEAKKVVTYKKEDKKKYVKKYVPPPPPFVKKYVPPPPTFGKKYVPPPPASPTGKKYVPPPPASPTVQVAVPPPPTIPPSTSIKIDIRLESQGYVIEQCVNQLGGFKAQNNVAAAAGPGVALRVVDCVCCQYAVNILADTYPQSCGQLQTDGPFVTSEFDYCARCSDNDGCKKCFASPDFGNPNADLSVIKECIVADSGATPPNVLPTSSIVTVYEVGTTNTLESDMDVCPPPNPPCTITRGGQTITLG